MQCTLCDAPLRIRMDAYYYDCESCGGIVMDQVYYLSPSVEKARYETHNNDVDDLGYQNFVSPITHYVLEHFLPEHKGLDFGSGTGPVISKMLEGQGYQVAQYDPFFAPDTQLLDATYDYIFSCEVFEHFYHPREEIFRLKRMLNPFGSLLIMTLLYRNHIDFKQWRYRTDETHVFIYRPETIAFISQNFGFRTLYADSRFIVFKKTD